MIKFCNSPKATVLVPLNYPNIMMLLLQLILPPCHVFIVSSCKISTYKLWLQTNAWLDVRMSQPLIEACWLAHGKNWSFEWIFSVLHRAPTLMCAECIEKLYVCIHEIKLFSHFSWQLIIFNWIVKRSTTVCPLCIIHCMALYHNHVQIYMLLNPLWLFWWIYIINRLLVPTGHQLMKSESRYQTSNSLAVREGKDERVW
jgi:hypothetical protein